MSIKRSIILSDIFYAFHAQYNCYLCLKTNMTFSSNCEINLSRMQQHFYSHSLVMRSQNYKCIVYLWTINNFLKFARCNQEVIHNDNKKFSMFRTWGICQVLWKWPQHSQPNIFQHGNVSQCRHYIGLCWTFHSNHSLSIEQENSSSSHVSWAVTTWRTCLARVQTMLIISSLF